jgi:uncharacterized protein (TIGR02466 family)
MSVENWFPVPIYFTNLEGVLFEQIQKEVKDGLENVSKLGNPWDDTVQTNFEYNKDNNFLELAPFLRDTICKETLNYINQLNLSKKVSAIHVLESWINIYPKYAYQNYHVHPNCDISGCYYFDTNGKDGDIKFKSPSPTMNHSLLSAQTNVFYKPKIGMLLLFPSYLEHAVLMNTTKHKRISVAFNLKISL